MKIKYLGFKKAYHLKDGIVFRKGELLDVDIEDINPSLLSGPNAIFAVMNDGAEVILAPKKKKAVRK